MNKVNKISRRKQIRKENKKKKLGALKAMKKINDEDRKNLKTKRDSDVNSCEEPSLKRVKNNFKYLINGQEEIKETPPVFGELTDEQKLLVRKLLSLRTKKRQERPYLELIGFAKEAELVTSADKRVPLTTDDFRQFVLYSVLNQMCPNGPPRWIQILKSEKVRYRIVLVLEGIGLNDYLQNEKHLETLREFEGRLEICTPLSYGGNLIQELAMVPISNNQKRLLLQEFGSFKEAMNSGKLMKKLFKINKNTRAENGKREDKFSRELLLLTPWEMIEENYPLPSLEGKTSTYSEGFVPTRDDYEKVSENSPMWAIDCEMCQTKKGDELTRVSIVNESHEVVYDTLVKPYSQITDYRTQYSGITKKLLKNVTTRIKDVQEHIRSICPPDVIFVGQSLNFDLKALKMVHPHVIDTSMIFNLSGVKNKKTKLRVLTEEFLSEKIQLGSGGHNPTEDALAAMKLVQAKLQHSYVWGNAVLSGQRPEEESKAARLLLEAREAAGDATLKGLKDTNKNENNCEEDRYSSSLMFQLTKHNNQVLLVGKESVIDEWKQYTNTELNNVHFLPVKSGKVAVKTVQKNCLDGGTTIVHLSLASYDPHIAIAKADKLVQMLFQNQMVNTLYTVLLAGRQKQNGVAFVHLLRENIPFVQLPSA